MVYMNAAVYTWYHFTAKDATLCSTPDNSDKTILSPYIECIPPAISCATVQMASLAVEHLTRGIHRECAHERPTSHRTPNLWKQFPRAMAYHTVQPQQHAV